MKEKRDFEWYHDHIDYDEYCLYPNDGDMCVYAVTTLSKKLEYIKIFRDLPDGRALRCRISIYKPEYIGITGSEYDLILSDKDKIKLLDIVTSTWNELLDFLKEEYTEYPEFKRFHKDISKLPLNPPDYRLLP